MGQSGSKAADQGNAVTGRAVGITGGGALKRLAAPKLPQGAVKANVEDYDFIEVCVCVCTHEGSHSTHNAGRSQHQCILQQ